MSHVKLLWVRCANRTRGLAQEKRAKKLQFANILREEECEDPNKETNSDNI